MAAKNKRLSESSGDMVFQIAVYVLVALILAVVLYPIYFVVIASISNPIAVFGGKVWLYPQGMNLHAYRAVWQNKDIWMGYRNSIVYTLCGTGMNVIATMMGAYALSRKKMFGRGPIMFFIVFTMFFNGGLIPTYLLVNKLGLYNTFWIMMLMGLVGVYNLIVARTYLQSTIDEQLYEASYMDGCSDARAFIHVALPLSAPIIAVLVLFYAVGHWNQYFNALIYLRDRSRSPLQIILREILVMNVSAGESEVLETDMSKFYVSETLKYAVIIVSSLPMLILYPFLQRFFIKGIMIGAIKG